MVNMKTWNHNVFIYAAGPYGYIMTIWLKYKQHYKYNIMSYL